MKTYFLALHLIAVPVAVLADAPGPETLCPQSPTERKPIPSPSSKKVDPHAQQIVVHCGTLNVTQPTGELPTVISGKSNDNAAPQWEKIIDALAKLLSSIAWPLAGVYIAIAFRKELAALLARLKRGKVGSAEFEFEESVRKVETKAEAAHLPRLENDAGEHAQLGKDRDDLFILARASPRAAVFEAWVRLEVAIGQGLRNAQIITDGEKKTEAYQPFKGAQVLFANYPKQLDYYITLKNLRNKVAHGEINAIEHKPACNFIELAFRLILFIENTWPNPAAQGTPRDKVAQRP